MDLTQEETYEALRTFQILGLEKALDITAATCPVVIEKLGSSASSTKDIFHALRANSILKCQIDAKTIEDMISRLQAVIKNADSLLDFYYSIGGLLQIKNQCSDVTQADADGVFHSIKALGQSDGRWRYDSSGTESSTYAAGIALETLAGVVSLADSALDQSVIGIVKKDILKLSDSIKSYKNSSTLVGAMTGTFGLLPYFNDLLEGLILMTTPYILKKKHVDNNEYTGPLITTASVVRGITSFASVASGKLSIPHDKILGLGRMVKFLLSTGTPCSSKDLFIQIDSLACLENNRVSILLILSLPYTMLSLTSRDQLMVEVTTVFGSIAPPLIVSLVEVINSDSKKIPNLENQELHFDPENKVHYLDILPLKLDVGKYTLTFETGGRTRAPTILTGIVKIDKAEIAILISDVGSVEDMHKLDLSQNSNLMLSANHLQKLRLSFQLTTTIGNSFKPHQVFLKLRHETKLEHIFILENSARQFKIVLDFLGLVEKFYCLSGKYDIELTVGDITMKNSFLRALANVELDLPEAPEMATHPPLQPVDPCLRFGLKQVISHIFRAPEKRPPKELYYAFLGFTLLPLVGFLIGLIQLGINLKGFPSSAIPATFSVLFHSCIAAILLLYMLFWLKLNLFTTKVLGFLGTLLVFVGFRTLSHLASSSAKLKSS